jgi:hypothetical protein
MDILKYHGISTACFSRYNMRTYSSEVFYKINVLKHLHLNITTNTLQRQPQMLKQRRNMNLNNFRLVILEAMHTRSIRE